MAIKLKKCPIRASQAVTGCNVLMSTWMKITGAAATIWLAFVVPLYLMVRETGLLDTQFLGALNDNVFKNAMAILILFRLATDADAAATSFFIVRGVKVGAAKT